MLPAPVLFSYFPKLTRTRARQLRSYFHTLNDAWQAPQEELNACGWKQDVVTSFVTWRNTIDSDTIALKLKREGIHTIHIDEPAYPPQLLNIFDPPLCLFVRGTIEGHNTSLSVVGSRKMTTYGSLVLEKLIPPLCDVGISIVSGLALGIDAGAHTASLKAGGHTIAVLGGGVDDQSIAPRANYRLAQEILHRGGALISEYPPGTEPTKYSFPERNRIIAALSRATLVVEAAAGSGSLITAMAAMEYGKDVCGVPHPIHSTTGAGVNDLIKQGAHMITQSAELLEIMHIEKSITASIPIELNHEERVIYTLLTSGEKHIDEIINATDHPNAQTMSLVTILEMKGVIKNIGNMTYIAL